MPLTAWYSNRCPRVRRPVGGAQTPVADKCIDPYQYLDPTLRYYFTWRAFGNSPSRQYEAGFGLFQICSLAKQFFTVPTGFLPPAVLALFALLLATLSIKATADELVCPPPPEQGWLFSQQQASEQNVPTSDSSTDKRLPSVNVVSLTYRVDFLDGNPLFFPDNKDGANTANTYPTLTGPLALEELSFEQFGALNVKRRGVAADGVSRLLLRFEATAPGKFRGATATGLEADGRLHFLRDGKTCETTSGHIAYAIYDVPDNFGRGTGMRPPTDEERLGGAEIRDVALGVSFAPEGHKKHLKKKTSIPLVRPPLVLVHGLLDNPKRAWLEPVNIGQSFTHYVQNAGFIPFLVDYTSSNGAFYPGLPDRSSFEENRLVVWGNVDQGSDQSFFNPSTYPLVENTATGESAFRGGIRQALYYYRNKLDVAAARADVIGHSMGGILARVYASDDSALSQSPDPCPENRSSYNPQYRRPENFGGGDINRLITMNSPHHGSGQTAIYELLTEKKVNGEPWSAWLYRTGAKYYANYYKQASTTTKAMRALSLRSCELRRIGATEVPSHIVASTAREYHLDDTFYDTDREYLQSLDALGALFYWYPVHLDELFDQIESDWEGTPWAETISTDTRQAYHDLVHWGYEPWMEQLEKEKQTGKKLWVPYTVLEPLRDLMFRFDQNDATVRLDSQLAGLNPQSPHVTYVAIQKGADVELSVLHRYVKQMLKVQLKVIDVLKSGSERYADKLPPAGQFMAGKKPINPSFDFLLDGSYAKKWSGMDFRHADAILPITRAAHKECMGHKDCKVIIMSRPVNPDATELIISGAATKGMNVKGKSSNWGPQKGYIPVEQRYSKLWNTDKGKIREFNVQTRSLLAATDSKYRDSSGKRLVIRKQLEHRWPRCEDPNNQQCQQSQRIYRVWYDDKGHEADATKSLYLCRTEASQGQPGPQPCDCGSKWYDWNTQGTSSSPRFSLANEPDKEVTPPDCQRLKPLDVFADNTHPDKPYLTADYDLLTTAFYCPQGTASAHPGCRGLVRLDDERLPKHQQCSHSQVPLVEGFVQLWQAHNPRPCFDPQTGLIAEAQKDLMDEINEAVKATGYTGGNVTHHGPETNFFKSPYVDYPITVFDPDGQNGPTILSIRKGPRGFRDVHLKRYYEKKLREGYWLYPNTFKDSANWKWKLRGEPKDISEFRGWEYADDPSLEAIDDVSELVPPDCVKKEIERLSKLKRGESAEPVPKCEQKPSREKAKD